MIFLYGTLLNPTIREMVLGIHIQTVPFILENFKIVSLKGRLYPGLMYESHAQTKGAVLKTSLSEIEHKRLMAYEKVVIDQTPLYKLKVVCKEPFLKAFVLNIPSLYQKDDWSIKDFEQQYLQTYLEQTEIFAQTFKV